MGRRRTLPARAGFAVLIAASVVSLAMLTSSVSPFQEAIPPVYPQSPGPDVTAQILQLAQPGVAEAATAIDQGSGEDQVCQAQARWLRVRFTELDLRGGDTVTVSGSESGDFTLRAENWPGKPFYTRAFPGSCVTINPHLSHKDSRFRMDAYQAGDTALADSSVIVAGAGDICGTSCERTADLITGIDPAAVLAVGDNAYEDGTLAQFDANYDPAWGAFRDKTYPVPGNHEYHTIGASGYFDYWNGTGNDTGRAGRRGEGYYSWDVGEWHFVAINSDIAHDEGSDQEEWLRADLAASTKPCTAAYTHHPRFSSGQHGDDTGMAAVYQALYDNRTDLLISGHDHDYERFAPARPDGTGDADRGLRSLVIGTGGRELYSTSSTSEGPSQVFDNNAFGVGEFTLTDTGYTVDFVPVAEGAFTDHVSGSCHDKD